MKKSHILANQIAETPTEFSDSHYLSEILAVIHGDGGHYQEKNGTKKAVEDAINKYYTKLKD